MKKKKVGFLLCSASWGGLEINVLRLSKWLTERDWDISFFLLKGTRIHKEASESFGGEINTIEAHRKYFDLVRAHLFSKVLKSKNIDTLFVFTNQSIDFVFFTKLFLKNRLCVVYQQQMQVGIRKKDWLHTMRFSAIDYWIAPLQWLKEQALQNTHVKTEKIHVIPLCTDVAQLSVRKYDKAEARNLLDIQTNSILMGIMGRIDPQKGQLFVIKATHQLIKLGVDIQLVVVGEITHQDEGSARYFNEMQNYIADNNIQDKVHLRGFTNDISMVYNAIDIFALASQSETFGMVTIEAMLAGLVVIGTNSGGTPELLKNGELGKLYEYNNIDDFCGKVKELLSDSSLITDMAMRAQQNAKERFSHKVECELIEKMIGYAR